MSQFRHENNNLVVKTLLRSLFLQPPNLVFRCSQKASHLLLLWWVLLWGFLYPKFGSDLPNKFWRSTHIFKISTGSSTQVKKKNHVYRNNLFQQKNICFSFPILHLQLIPLHSLVKKLCMQTGKVQVSINYFITFIPSCKLLRAKIYSEWKKIIFNNFFFFFLSAYY